MAALDFPLSPTTSTEVTTGDITWKWNGYAWYAVSESDTDLDNIFLSKVNDDTAAGAITFEGRTTHEAGVSVTGGFIVQGTTTSGAAAGSGVFAGGYVRQFCNQSDYPEGDINNPQPFQVLSAPTDASAKSVVLSLNASGSAYFKGLTEHAGGISVTGGEDVRLARFLFDIPYNNTNSTFVGSTVYLTPSPEPGFTNEDVPRSTECYRASPQFNNGNSVHGTLSGYYFDGNSLSAGNSSNFDLITSFHSGAVGSTTVTDTFSGLYAGFYGNADAGGNRYNFYAAGTAPNFFRGEVIIGDSSEADPLQHSYCRINSVRFLSNCRSTLNDGYNANFRRHTDGNFVLFSGYASNTNQTIGNIGRAGGFLTIVGTAGGPLILDEGADARNITSTEEITNATAVVQALQPVKINGTRHGFTAADMPTAMAEAVNGTADAELTIGTYTDTDGNVETDVAEPDVIPAGASFVATGTRPLYQGVDQTKLIPLLTKALQEALARIEALENA